MAANKILRIPPVLLTTGGAALLNPGTGAKVTAPVGYTDSDDYIIIRHIRVHNNSGSTATVTCSISTSNNYTAGTEFAFNFTNVLANSFVDWYGMARIEGAQFLNGKSGTASVLSINIEAEVGKI